MTPTRHTGPTSPTGTRPGPGWWRRLTSKIDEVGVRYTAALVMRSMIPAPLFRFTRMVILEIRPRPAPAPVAEYESIRWAGPDDVAHLQALGHTVEVLHRRLSAGARACILVDGEEILAYVWFHGPYHDEDDLGVRFCLNAGEIWLFDAMVSSDHRGRGLYPRMLRTAARDLGRQGVQRILIAIDTENRNSVHAHQTAGAHPIGVVWSLRILGFTVAHHGQGLQSAWSGRSGYVGLDTSRIA